MLLTRLVIFRGPYDYSASNNPADPLNGEVSFHGDRGDKISIRLNEDTARKILDIVAQGLVEASKKVACDLTAEILTQTATLPAPDQAQQLS